jgi:hypothetical protein
LKVRLDRLRLLVGPLVAVVAVVGWGLAGVHGGYSQAHPRLLAGSAWLVSAKVGQLTLLDGSSVEVAAQVRVATPGSRLEAAQQGSTGYVMDRSAGSVRRVDGATFGVSTPAVPLPRARDALRLFTGQAGLYALDSRAGVATELDPDTLTGRHGQLSLARRVWGASSRFRDSRAVEWPAAGSARVFVGHGGRGARSGASSVAVFAELKRRGGIRGSARPARRLVAPTTHGRPV